MERAIQAGNPHLFRNAGLLLGIGLGGFFDGIVLHQLLQWHHMVSSVSFFAPTTLPGLRTNTFADGLFHAVTYLATIAGIALLWRAVRSGQSGSARQLIAEPYDFAPVVRIGSMLGSTGSMYGGRKIRPAFGPCWWMSLLICGVHGV